MARTLQSYGTGKKNAATITVPKNEAMLSGKSIVSSALFETCPAKIFLIDIPNMVSGPRPARAFFVIFFLLDRFTSLFPFFVGLT
jgi:hypothetical protein